MPLYDNKPSPGIPWNKLAGSEQEAIVELALDKPELSPRELAVTYTDHEARYVSESTVYRLLKAHDLITSPAYILCKQVLSSRHESQRDVADGFYLLQGHGLGLVLPVDHTR